jgi:hypothetical protein
VRRLLALLATLLVVATACSDDGGPLDPAALTIDGTVVVSQSQLESELQAIADSPEIAQRIFGELSMEGEAPGSIAPAAASTLLTIHALDHLLSTAVEERDDLAVTDADRSAARDQLIEQMATVDPATGMPSEAGLAGIPQSLQDAIVDLLTAQVALDRSFVPPAVAEITDDDVRAAYDQRFPDLVDAGGEFTCTSHILAAFSDDVDDLRNPEFVPTDEQRQAAAAEVAVAQARLAAGEDFAVVAAEVSDDTTSGVEGGDLGCNQPGGFVETFDAAAQAQEIGVVGEPVETDFGFHLILVRTRGLPPFEDVADDLRTQLEGEAQQETEGARQQAFGDLVLAATEAADVVVDPRYGTWDAEQVVDLGAGTRRAAHLRRSLTCRRDRYR